MLQSMELQKAGHDLVPEPLNYKNDMFSDILFFFSFSILFSIFVLFAFQFLRILLKYLLRFFPQTFPVQLQAHQTFISQISLFSSTISTFLLFLPSYVFYLFAYTHYLFSAASTLCMRAFSILTMIVLNSQPKNSYLSTIIGFDSYSISLDCVFCLLVCLRVFS